VRLDHLLSKEHTPASSPVRPATVLGVQWWRHMVVFTSGIIDISLPVVPGPGRLRLFR
jgi:hypothetical protein